MINLISNCNDGIEKCPSKTVFPNLDEYSLHIPKAYAKGINKSIPNFIGIHSHYELVVKRGASKDDVPKIYWKLPHSKRLICLTATDTSFMYNSKDLNHI